MPVKANVFPRASPGAPLRTPEEFAIALQGMGLLKSATWGPETPHSSVERWAALNQPYLLDDPYPESRPHTL